MKSQTSSHPKLRELETHLAQHHANLAELLSYLAEIGRRKLYLPAGYSSMYLYCVHAFHMDEDTALERIEAARTALQFPALFPALADGRLDMRAVILLAPRLAPETVDELILAATHKSGRELERLLAERFA